MTLRIGRDEFRRGRNRDDVIREIPSLSRAIAAGDRDDRPAARFHLLDVVDVLRKNRVLRNDEHRRQRRADQRDDAVF